MPGDLEPLLRRIASGDGEAFARVYDEWFETVLGQARRAARGDAHAAEDVAQEVFVRFIRRTPIVDSRAALGAWFRRAAITVAIDRARADSRRAGRESVRAPRDAGMGAERVLREEEIEWLRAELASIDADTRALLIQRFGVGRTLSQIGALFGLAPGAVDGRISLALKAMRRRVEEARRE